MLNIKHFVIFTTIMLCFSCKKPAQKLNTIQGVEIAVTDTLKVVDSIDAFVKPYRIHIDSTLDAPLAYSKYTLSKTNGELNTAIGNLMADIVLEQSDPVFYKRTGKHIDFVLLNHGGIRAVISQGNVSTRTAYEVMPFENSVVVLELKGSDVQNMLTYLAKNKKAHPVSGIEISLNKDYSLHKVSIGNKPLDTQKTYFVATSDYLAASGDNMSFFENPVTTTAIDYKIRNELIDYFTKVDTLAPVIDTRFIRLQ